MRSSTTTPSNESQNQEYQSRNLTPPTNNKPHKGKDIQTPPPPHSQTQSPKAKNPVRPPTGILKYNGAVPPAPAQIYHGNNNHNFNNETKTEIKEYHIRMNINLKKYRGKTINIGKSFKKNIGVLKRADPTLLVLPLKNSSTDTILHRIAHVPSKGEDLKNYLDYKMGKFQAECLFKIRTSKSMYQLKQYPGTMDILC